MNEHIYEWMDNELAYEVINWMDRFWENLGQKDYLVEGKINEGYYIDFLSISLWILQNWILTFFSNYWTDISSLGFNELGILTLWTLTLLDNNIHFY